MGTHRLVCPKCGENLEFSEQVTLNRKYSPLYVTEVVKQGQSWLESVYTLLHEEDEFVNQISASFVCYCGFGHTVTTDSPTEEFLQKYPNAWKVVE